MKTLSHSEDRVIRPPVCAGRFYPAAPGELRAEVEGFLARAQPSEGPVPKAIIAPHAGYMYSGPIAGSAYRRLAAARDSCRRVVLLGPSHYADFAGLAASAADAFATPLGLVSVDKSWLAKAEKLPQVSVLERAHQPEHSLEVHLPFLQTMLAEFDLIPLLVADATDEEISQVLDLLWGGPETRIVVSSDLSHYHDYATARRLDQATSEAIEGLRPEALSTKQACGCRPVRALLRAARQRALRVQTVDLRNSGDTAGARDRVVGYGAYVFTEN